MRALQALMMLIGAFAVLMTGVAPAVARDAAAAPCHETMAHDAPASPSSGPGKAAMTMDCCVACVASPLLSPPLKGRMTAPRPAAVAAPQALPAGERPAPEPHPPRPPLD